MSMAVLQTLFTYKLAVVLAGPVGHCLPVPELIKGVCGRENCRYKSMEAHGILDNCNFKNSTYSFVYAECLNSGLHCGV